MHDTCGANGALRIKSTESTEGTEGAELTKSPGCYFTT